jgi:hypothetical protein
MKLYNQLANLLLVLASLIVLSHQQGKNFKNKFVVSNLNYIF